MCRIGIRESIKKLSIDKPVGSFRVIGLDIATKLGFAVCDLDSTKTKLFSLTQDFNLQAGVIKLTGKASEEYGMRINRFRELLTKLKPDYICYESVKQHFVSNCAAVSYGALFGTLAGWAAENNIPTHGFHVGTIKKFMTGKGNAKKPEMISAANLRFNLQLDPNNEKRDSDVADALAILAIGLEKQFDIKI